MIALVTGASSGIGAATARRLARARRTARARRPRAPGFVTTAGFPQRELRAGALTRWLVSRPERVAEAIIDTGLRGKTERYVPRPYWLATAMRVLAPALVRHRTGGAGAMTPATAPRRAAEEP